MSVEYLKRNLETHLKEMSTKYPVVTVTGPRQSGKTTLIRHMFSDKKYYNLEAPDTRELIISDPRRFLNENISGAIIDEVQNFPDLLSYIQVMVDENDIPGQFILSGSQNFAISNIVSQSLAGRTAMLTLLPLTIAELKDLNSEADADNYLINGFFPRIYKSQINYTDYYRDYLHTFVERDIRQLANIKDLTLFQKFIRLCAGRIGQVVNYSSLANEIGISHKTVQEWISLLEASYIIMRLPPYYNNFGKRLIKSAKLYFVDTGLAAFLLGIENKIQMSRDPLRGLLFENLVVMEITKNRLNRGKIANMYFYRDQSGNEVDLIIDQGQQKFAIEIKSSETFNPGFTKGLRYLDTVANNIIFTPMVIYAGKNIPFYNDISIRHFTDISDL